ncbi:MAG: RluA family pseudouridine synthase [Clostridia bacterium]|nr:RluA family pseudouridine synthase [Clostridia bacterium]
MEILFEDKNIVCAVKEPGVPSQPDPTGAPDMTAYLKAACGCEIFTVHRLDTATGGIMVYAKSSKAAGRMSEALAKGQKQYLAWVYGEPGEGEMRDLLYHDKRINKSFVVKGERKGVKEALLDYKTLEKKDGKALVLITLRTGRTHQIRVQFSSRGYPLAGDGKYGAKDNEKLSLWCTGLSFTHPYTDEKMSFESIPTWK